MNNNENQSKEKILEQDLANGTGLVSKIHVFDEEFVLEDPSVFALLVAEAKSNCRHTLDLNLDRVAHFTNRVVELKCDPGDVVIVVVNVDDNNGSQLAEILMPGEDWQQYRDKGQTPFARGLAGRAGILDFLDHIDTAAATKLKSMNDLSVVVVDNGVAEIYSAKIDD